MIEGNKMKNPTIIEKWLSGQFDSQSHHDRQEADFINRLDEEIQARKAPQFDVEGELTRFNATKPSSLSKQVWLPLNTWMKVAAVVTLVLLGWFTWDQINGNQLDILISKAGETQEHWLPDSSRVVLNAGSSLAYDSKKWEEQRTIALSGEAYFVVRKGSKFEVKSEQGKVEVLGTQLNVRDRSGLYEVECYEGSVAVTTEALKTKKILVPGEKVQVINSELTAIEKVPMVDAPSWLEDRISFQSTSLAIVLDEMSRQFDIEIVTENIDKNQKFTGGFSKNNLSIALETLTNAMSLRFTMLEKRKVLIYSERP